MIKRNAISKKDLMIMILKSEFRRRRLPISKVQVISQKWLKDEPVKTPLGNSLLSGRREGK
jgi:hypothetical protein